MYTEVFKLSHINLITTDIPKRVYCAVYRVPILKFSMYGIYDGNY